MNNSRISKRYAKALLSLGREDGNYGDYGRNLQEFAEFCVANEEFYNVISNRIFPIEERKKIVETVLGKTTFSPTVINFLLLLVDKNRIGAVKDITEYYLKLMDDISGITRADVIAAASLKDGALNRLIDALKGLVSKDIKVTFREDKSIIGGLVVKIGDLVLDGSVKTQLQGLRESLKRGEYN